MFAAQKLLYEAGMDVPSPPKKLTEWEYDPPQWALRVIYEDEELLAIDKPAGLLSVPGKGERLSDCAISRLEASGVAALLVHRLDCDTSGVLVFAKTRSAQRHLGLQFEKRALKKRYIAWVHGCPDETRGEVNLPIIVDWPNRPRQKICHETGREAITLWRLIGKKGAYSRLELVPRTGRSHQLRVHMQAIGHPILGDRLYGEEDGAERLMLHAQRLELRHPLGGEWVRIESALPEGFGEIKPG